MKDRIATASDTEAKIEILRRLAPRMRIDLTFSYGEDVADLVVATGSARRRCGGSKGTGRRLMI